MLLPLLGREPVIQGAEPLGIFDNLTLLRLLAVDTPRAILPGRRVGGVGDGDEATFLVLEGNPIERLGNLLHIRLRVRRGEVIALPAAPLAPPHDD